MELTFKIVLDKRHQKKNEAYPLKLRIFQNRLFKECSLNIDIPDKDWNNNMQLILPSNENYNVLNSKLSFTKAKVQKLICLNEDEKITPDKIISILKNKGQNKTKEVKLDILKYGKEHIAKLKTSGFIGNAIAYSCSINKLESYVNTDSLKFEDINYKFLQDFNSTLLNEGIKINSISLYFRSIRALFNKAIKEGLLEAKFYPFTAFKIKSEKTISRALTKGEISQIFSIDLANNTSIWHYRNLFTLSYCFIGMNFADLLTLTKDNFVDGRLVFRRRKTHKIYSIKIPFKAKEILKYYFNDLPSCNKEFVLPFVKNKNNPLSLKKDVLQTIKNTNDYLSKITKLCSINKNVTTYYARYSWANIARELGYSKDMIAEGLGHEYGNKVTGIYLDQYDNEIIDSMNENVINSVLN